MDPNDVLSRLPIASWRGIEVPLLSQQARFDQDQARHVYQFRDNAVIEALGSRNWDIQWVIPFRQGIAIEPFSELFFDVLPLFLGAVRDRSPGDLYDPILGYYRCRVTSVDEQAVPGTRDGVDVTVGFIHDPEPGELDLPGADLYNIPSLQQGAGALDAEVGELFESDDRPPPEPTVDPLRAIAGAGQQITQNINRAQANVANFQNRVQTVQETIEDLERPDLAPLVRSARRLRANAEFAKDRVTNPLGIIRRVTTTVAKSVAAVAAELAVTPGDLLKLNPSLATSPLVPAGTVVTYEDTSG